MLNINLLHIEKKKKLKYFLFYFEFIEIFKFQFCQNLNDKK
jgi:hypothetical protein